MDVDSFAQCLTYASSTIGKKSTLDILITPGTALASFAVGFFANMWRDSRKEAKVNKNKMMCIAEEILRTKTVVEQMFKESLKILEVCQGPAQEIIGHKLESEIVMPYVDEFFWSVAHKYTESYREHLAFLSPAIRKLNNDAQTISEKLGVENLGSITIRARNLAVHSVQCQALCQTLTTGTAPKDASCVLLADELNITTKYIEELRKKLATKPTKSSS